MVKKLPHEPVVNCHFSPTCAEICTPGVKKNGVFLKLPFLLRRAGGHSRETAWVFGQLSNFTIYHAKPRKPSFRYMLPLVGEVCRPCWILSAGYVNKNNSRVRSVEANIRKGQKGLPAKLPKKILTTASSYARAFCREFVRKNNQSSPSDKIKYVEFTGIRDLFAAYEAEVDGCDKKLLCGSFVKTWEKVLRDGYVDPETAVIYEIRLKKKRAKGFSHCDICELLKMLMAGEADLTKRAAIQRRLDKHVGQVVDDREALARIQRMCITSRKHVGFFMDAADSNKFALPTTTSSAKLLSKLWRIKQKLTCVQIFNHSKSLFMFRTLPHVPTGGNLTATILISLLARPMFDLATDIWINVDGAGDNICYTLLYFFVHVLLSAKKKGSQLRRIHLLRMKVGQYIYGNSPTQSHSHSHSITDSHTRSHTSALTHSHS